MAKLTDIACRSKGAGMHCDGDGLYLQVKLGATGLNRSWILRYMIAGRARSMGIGPYNHGASARPF